MQLQKFIVFIIIYGLGCKYSNHVINMPPKYPLLLEK